MHFLSHLIAFIGKNVLQDYFAYYEHSRTHLALAKDAPEPRAVEKPEQGRIIAIPQVGGLHHRYRRQAYGVAGQNQLTLAPRPRPEPTLANQPR